jgi:hypothetical protein
MYLTTNKKERCVMARIRRQRRLYQANFTLKEYGSWKAARAAAAKWVSNLAKNLPPPLTSKDRLTPRNNSGVVGVFRHREVHRKPNGRKAVYYSWVARWPGCPSRGGVKWSVRRFGEDDGFVLAVLSRRMEIEGRDRVLAALKEAKDKDEFTRLLALRKH